MAEKPCLNSSFCYYLTDYATEFPLFEVMKLSCVCFVALTKVCANEILEKINSMGNLLVGAFTCGYCISLLKLPNI